MKSERALVTQMLEVLESGLAYVENEANQLTTREYKAAIKAAREYLATEPRGERSELIQWLRGAHRVLGNENSKTIADMLETDAQPKQVTCLIYGHVVGACVECNTHIEAQQAKPYGWMVKGVPTVMRGSLAQEIQEQEAKRIGGECHAFPVYTTPQQAKQAPMTAEEIEAVCRWIEPSYDGPIAYDLLIARAIEAHHGITPADKPTVDEPEDLYALALKADNWGQP